MYSPYPFQNHPSLYSPYPFQNHPCILPILSNIILVFSLSCPISSLISPYPFQYHTCILPTLSNIILVFSLSILILVCFLSFPILSLYPPSYINLFINIIQVYNIHQSVHNCTPLPPYPFQYNPCILPILSNIILVSSLSFPISSFYPPYPFQYHPCILPILSNIIFVSSLYPFQCIHVFSQWPFQYPCMDPYPLPISSLYSPYILSNIILVFSLSFPISSLYSPYPFRYHPCILPISFPISSLYPLYLYSPYPFQYHILVSFLCPCILPNLSNIILVSSLSIPISSLYPLYALVFSLSFTISSLYRPYPFQYHPCIVPIL